MEVQTDWIHILENLRAREFNTDEFFDGSMGLCELGSIICVLLSMAKDKNSFTVIEWVGDMGNIFYITPY